MALHPAIASSTGLRAAASVFAVTTLVFALAPLSCQYAFGAVGKKPAKPATAPAAEKTKTLLPGDIPTMERLQTLGKYFSPPIGGVAPLDPVQLRDYANGSLKDPTKMRGQITVSPPPNTCFTIARTLEDPDVVVCKETQLPFFVRDLTESGGFAWMVKTGPGDFGTQLAWKTTVRYIKYIPHGKPFPGQKETQFLLGCRTQKNALTGRRVYFTVLGEPKEWVFVLPEKDTLGAEIAAADAPGKTADDVWYVDNRPAYSVDSSQLMSHGSNPKGMKGSCRYYPTGNYFSRKEGWIECHGSSHFALIYIPAPCLSEVVAESK